MAVAGGVGGAAWSDGFGTVDRTGTLDGGLVGAEVALDDSRVLENLCWGPLRDHGAEFEGDHAVADGRQQCHVVLDDQNRAFRVVAYTK
jgi:hypothetical protein